MPQSVAQTGSVCKTRTRPKSITAPPPPAYPQNVQGVYVSGLQDRAQFYAARPRKLLQRVSICVSNISKVPVVRRRRGGGIAISYKNNIDVTLVDSVMEGASFEYVLWRVLCKRHSTRHSTYSKDAPSITEYTRVTSILFLYDIAIHPPLRRLTTGTFEMFETQIDTL